MNLRYGLNESDSWWQFALGPKREQIWARLRETEPHIVRMFLFDKFAPDPVRYWPMVASYIQAVLNLGAVPMITFAKLDRPLDDPRALRWFANQCSDVVWSCVEQWGGEAVRNWYWCVWNEPNSSWISGQEVTFDQYRRVYESVAEAVLRWLGPHLMGTRPRIGGPAVEGFQPFWWDWVWRFVNEIDNSLIGFVDWHRYADWRDHGESGAPWDPAIHRALLMSQTPDYESRARDIARLLRGRDILNVCGEWNAHSHYWTHVRARFNQSAFGAAYVGSALAHLMRSEVDVEMFWTGTDEGCGYGLISEEAVPWPAFHVKRLCARYIRHGDWLSFPSWESAAAPLDVVVARGADGRKSALLVHKAERVAAYPLSALSEDLADCRIALKIDSGTEGRVVRSAQKATARFDGYGVSVLTNGWHSWTATGV